MNVCKTCRHPEQKEVNRLLLSGEPIRSISEQFGLTRDSLCRHRKKCIPALLAEAAEAEATRSDVERFMAQVAETVGRSLEAVDKHGLPDYRVRHKAIEAAIKLFGLG